MSFATGTSDTREDLLDQFRAFALAAGWTIDRFAASGTGYVLNIHKTGANSPVYASLRSVNNEDLLGAMPTMVGIVLSGADGYDSAKDCVDQPGSILQPSTSNNYYATSINPFTAVSKFWFFANSTPVEFLAMVVMLPNGQFRHLVIAEINKKDPTLGKGFGLFGTSGLLSGSVNKVLPFETTYGYDTNQGTSYLRLVADERDGWWTSSHKGTLAPHLALNGGIGGPKLIDEVLLKNSLNQFSNIAGLQPINLYYLSQGSKYRPIGYIPDLRISRADAFLVDTVYPLGADNWMAFPTANLSDPYALVYRKVVA